MSDLIYWLGFSLIPSIGMDRLSRLLAIFGSAENAWKAPAEELQRAGVQAQPLKNFLHLKNTLDLNRELDKVHRAGASIITHEDFSYPALLKTIADAPILLYVRGTLEPEDARAIAIVGTRASTLYGRDAAAHLGKGLAAHRVTIVSGLAHGIDAAAHRAALEAHGRTIAVFGCGIDRIYPPEHRDLARQITEAGALISEFPMGAKPERYHFPRRNRLISGLSLGVLVVEADEDSGALITATAAAEQGRDVFAVPGSIFHPNSRGTHRLIQDGAKLVMHVNDILEELNIKHEAATTRQKAETIAPASPIEAQIMSYLGDDPIHVDQIVRNSGLVMATVSSTLTLLELKGLREASVTCNIASPVSEPERVTMISNSYYALILAGGGGTRLWPMSRTHTPKQLLPLVEAKSMFGVSVERLAPLFPPDHIFVVAGEKYIDALRAHAPEIPLENFISEPYGKDNGPAALLGITHIHHRDPNATIAYLTADHHIADKPGFIRALSAAYEIAQTGYIATLGISPSLPSTAFGYVQRGQLLGEYESLKGYQAAAFTEKPDLATAMGFIASGDYSWNSGMFIWTAVQALGEFEQQRPAMAALMAGLASTIGTDDYLPKLKQVWDAIEKIAIDYAVMEGAERMAVIPIDIGWSDVGSWDALFDVLDLDETGNGFRGSSPDRIIINTKNTLVYSDKLVVTIGIEDTVIIDTGDVLMVCHKESTQSVKDVVNMLKASNLETYL